MPMPVEDFTTCGAGLLGRSIRVLPVVDSTNDLLKIEAENDLVNCGDILIAEHQTAGKGRLDRTWEAPPGKSLLFSMVLDPRNASGKMQLMGLMVSLGISDGIQDFFRKHHPQMNHLAEAVKLKWPNDLMVGKRKLCGILSEAGISKSERPFVVVGTGLNVNQSLQDFPRDLRNIATSLHIMSGVEHSRADLLKEIIAGLNKQYQRLLSSGADWIVPAWMQKAAIKDKLIEVKESMKTVAGCCLGLNADGAIRLELPDGSVKVIYSGDLFE